MLKWTVLPTMVVMVVYVAISAVDESGPDVIRVGDVVARESPGPPIYGDMGARVDPGFAPVRLQDNNQLVWCPGDFFTGDHVRVRGRIGRIFGSFVVLDCTLMDDHE